MRYNVTTRYIDFYGLVHGELIRNGHYGILRHVKMKICCPRVVRRKGISGMEVFLKYSPERWNVGVQMGLGFGL